MSVNLAELIHKGGVFNGLEGSSPEEIYKKITEMMEIPAGLSSDFVCRALCEREKILSTAVGNGIALPHARIPIVKDEKDQRICVVYLKNPIDMDAPDERKVFVMFVILSSDQKNHLQVLSELVHFFQDMEFRKLLEQNASEAELLNKIRKLS